MKIKINIVKLTLIACTLVAATLEFIDPTPIFDYLYTITEQEAAVYEKYIERISG